MSPEYGATCGFFPVDDETLRYLRLTGRSEERVALVEAYCKENMPLARPGRARDLLAGRRARPLDRRAVARRPAAAAGPDRALRDARTAFLEALADLRRRLRERDRRRDRRDRSRRATRRRADARRSRAARRPTRRRAPCRAPARPRRPLRARRRDRRSSSHGAVVIAAITSCTNTSNPAVMVGAGLLAKKAVERGLTRQAVGQDEPRARLEGRDRVLRARRA